MPALLANTAAYAAQVLRNAKVDAKVDPTGDGQSMILSARGTFYMVRLTDTYGPGIYSIDELTRDVLAPDDKGPSATEYWAEYSPILLTSIEFNQVDITSQVPCLNNVKVFYSFGQNFGQVVIQGEVLLGPMGDMSYAGVERLVSFFWRNRVSVKQKPVAVSVADNAYFVYLTGLRIGQVNPDFHIMPFVMFGTLMDITREQASAVNIRGQVFSGGSLTEPSLFEALQQTPSAESYTYKKVGENRQAISTSNDPSLYADPYDEYDEEASGVVSDSEQKSKAGPTADDIAMTVEMLNRNNKANQQAKDLAWVQDEKDFASVKLVELVKSGNAATQEKDARNQAALESAQAEAEFWSRASSVQGDRAVAANNFQCNQQVSEAKILTKDEFTLVTEALDYTKSASKSTPGTPQPVPFSPVTGKCNSSDGSPNACL